MKKSEPKKNYPNKKIDSKKTPHKEDTGKKIKKNVMNIKEIIEPEYNKKYFQNKGTEGANKVLAKYGIEHYRKMAQKRWGVDKLERGLDNNARG